VIRMALTTPMSGTVGALTHSVVTIRRTLILTLALLVSQPDDRLATAEPSPEPTVHYGGAPTALRQGDPIEDGDRSLAAGRFEEALSLYLYALEQDPENRHALREAGRAAHAMRDFNRANLLLTHASELTRTPDPELHYLLGEARWVLGQTALARQVHLQAKTEIGATPPSRIEKLWLARIESRLGDRATANAIYMKLIAAAPADAEIALAQVELHAAAADWPAAETSVRRFLALAPHNTRALEMLAWILEAQGEVAKEFKLRETLAGKTERVESVRDYGRALERAGNWAGALTAYRRAAELPDGAKDLVLTRALERVEQRMAVELGAGAIARTDPTATGIGVFTGVAVPFGRASHWTLRAVHELVSRNDIQVYAGEVGAAVTLRQEEAFAIAGAKLGGIDVEADPIEKSEHRRMLAPGVFAAASSGLLAGHFTLSIDGEIGSVWRETPAAVFEGGRVDAVAAHAYVSGLGQRLVIDTGGQARHLRLTADAGMAPSAQQLLVWGGADLLVWRDFAREATGQILDDDLLRPTFAADSAVVGYRHYEMVSESEPMFTTRLAIAERASIDEVSVTARKVFSRGRIALEARGGIGRDWARELNLARGGLSLWLAPGSRSRISLAFDIAKESVRAFEGERRTGWMTYHVDL